MSSGRRKMPAVSISEVKLRPPPPRHSCGSQTIQMPEESSDGQVEEEPAKPPTLQEPEVKEVTVKFHFNEASIVTRIYNNYMTLAEVKLDLSKRFEVKPYMLLLKQFDCIVTNECCIYETIDDEFGIYNYNLELVNELPSDNLEFPDQSGYHDNYEDVSINKNLDIETYNSKYRMPDTITVHIPSSEDKESVAETETEGEGRPKTVTVEIGRKSINRTSLCGYKDKRTGTKYTHNYSQTGPIFDKIKYSRYVSRDTQTQELKPCLIDTTHDHSTQCWLDENNALHWSEPHDYYITPGKYQTYAQKERQERKLYKIKLIQRNFRRFKWVRWMKACAAEYRRLIANLKAEEEEFRAEGLRRIAREERMKQFPRTKYDFDLLLAEIHNWKMAELRRITDLYEGAARIVEFNILLNKEIELLNALERQRTATYKSLEDFRLNKMLEKMGTPVKWFGYGNTIVHLDLLRTQRVRFYNEIYQDLCKPLPKDERIQLIDKVLILLQKEADFPDFPQLFELFEREKNLLIHASNCDVEVLRKRQNLLFLELIKYDREPKLHDQGNRLCIVCKKVKPYSQFLLHTRQYNVDTCSHCHYLKVPSIDYNIYMPILRQIQRDERRRRCNGSFAFVMQMEDIRYLLLQVWHRHSILSKVDDIKRLRLPRWNKAEEWSPWNCVCLTDEESRDHERISDLEAVYDHKLILEVRNRHMLARSTFHTLSAVAVEFTESGRWWKVGLNPQRVVRLSDVTGFPTVEKMLRPQLNERFYKIGKIL